MSKKLEAFTMAVDCAASAMRALDREVHLAKEIRRELEAQAQAQACTAVRQKDADENLVVRERALAERDEKVTAREISAGSIGRELSIARVETKTARDAEKKFREKFEAEREKYNKSQNENGQLRTQLSQLRKLRPQLFAADGSVWEGVKPLEVGARA